MKSKKYLLICSGIISIIYFSIPIFLYSATGNITYKWDQHPILVWLMSLCPPSTTYFYSINFMEFHSYSYLVQLGLVLIGWVVLYYVVMLPILLIRFIKSKQ